MNNKISLGNFLATPKMSSDYAALFYGLHHESRQLMEQKGAYVPYFDLRFPSSLPKTLKLVEVNWSNARDVTCLDSVVVPLEHRETAKQLNIEYLVTLAVGCYMEYDMQNGLLNRDFLASHFEEIKSMLPENDVPYYENVLVHRKYEYYDEYKQKQAASSGAALGGIQFVLGGSGRGYTEIEEDPLNNKAAFAQSVFLSAAFFTIAIITVAVVLFVVR